MADASIKKLARQYKSHNLASALWLVTLSMLFNLVIASIIGYKVIYPTERAFFTTTYNSIGHRIVALDQPNQSDSAVIDWAAQTALATYTFNWDNWQTQLLRSAQQYFTEQGWQTFLSEFQASNTLSNVIGKKLIVSSVVVRRPIILQKGPLLGTYTWRIQMPVLISYQGPGEIRDETLIVTMLITRMSTLENPRGIGVAQFLARPAVGVV